MVRAGVWSTIQDRGRVGFRGFGVPEGGAFDREGLDLANALLGNDPSAAAVELTLVGGEFRAECPLALALAGAAMAATVGGGLGEDRALSVPGSFAVRAGETLRLGGCPSGARAYLAVGGGFEAPVVLGSRSSEARLRAGDRLSAAPGWTWSRRPVASFPQEAGPIRVINGPDAEPASGGSGALESGPYRVSTRADRMGLRLEGPAIDQGPEGARPSAPVAPGAVQVAGGRPIVLGVAGGTRGGYAHLAHVISADLARLGQLRPGDLVAFRRVEVEEARRVDRERRRELGRWLASIRAMGRDRGGIPAERGD